MAGYGAGAMEPAPGHDPGHPSSLTWGEWLARLVAEHGSLAAVALRLVEARGWSDDAQTVERGLRRLRERGHRDGGEYGRRLLACFGVPPDVERRARWMGSYHTRFTDLPRSVGAELLRAWDVPPLRESRVRPWVQIGLASVALRGGDHAAADLHLREARAAANGAGPAARCELALVGAFTAHHRGDHARVESLLREAGDSLDAPGVEPDDRACLHARWVDQRAFRLNHPREGAPDHRGALALYESIPEGSPPFARSRRASGLAWTRWRLGERGRALELAADACEHAGDGGFLRLRAMALNLVARIAEGPEAARARGRALAIARSLEDEDLAARIER